MLECVCVRRISYRILSLGRRGLQSSVLTWRGCIVHNTGGSGVMLLQIFFKEINALRFDSEAF